MKCIATDINTNDAVAQIFTYSNIIALRNIFINLKNEIAESIYNWR